ncbi:MAG: C4-dicarboxylate ABC transporter substrate-binding protein, partial [Desulfosalsimonas sp.]
VQEYCTQLNNEPFIGIPSVNLEFFESLPEEAQQEMLDYWQNAILPAGEWITERNASDMKKMKEDKPELEFNHLDEEAIAAFKAAAETVYPMFKKIGGEGSEEILEAMLKDIADAKKALDIE